MIAAQVTIRHGGGGGVGEMTALWCAFRSRKGREENQNQKWRENEGLVGLTKFVTRNVVNTTVI